MIMVKFDIITIFPEIFTSYFKESLIKRAVEKRLIKINVHNLRKWAADRHKTVDDRPFGGGLGMVMRVAPIYKAVKALKKSGKSKVILFTPRGKKFSQQMATKWSKLNHLILICGRYEGVDERVAKYIADEEVSMGEYVLMGGEIPAMVVVETVSRLVPGVIGKSQFLSERVTKDKGFIEYPQYTRPEEFKGKAALKGRASPSFAWRVPKVLISGNHKKIAVWREKYGKVIES